MEFIQDYISVILMYGIPIAILVWYLKILFFKYIIKSAIKEAIQETLLYTQNKNNDL